MKKEYSFVVKIISLVVMVLALVGCSMPGNSVSEEPKEEVKTSTQIAESRISDSEFKGLLRKAHLTEAEFREALQAGGVGNYITHGKTLLYYYVKYDIRTSCYYASSFKMFCKTGAKISKGDIDNLGTFSLLLRAVYDEVADWGSSSSNVRKAKDALPCLVDIVKNRTKHSYWRDKTYNDIIGETYNGVTNPGDPIIMPLKDSLKSHVAEVYTYAYKMSYKLVRYGKAYSDLPSSFVYCYESKNGVPRYLANKKEGRDYIKRGYFYFSEIYCCD